jgi:hypothetical protein
VGVTQGGDGARLLLEPAQPLGVVTGFGGKNLERDLTGEPRVPRPVHLAHPAGAQSAAHFVGAQTGSVAENHRARPRRDCSG